MPTDFTRERCVGKLFWVSEAASQQQRDLSAGEELASQRRVAEDDQGLSNEHEWIGVLFRWLRASNEEAYPGV